MYMYIYFKNLILLSFVSWTYIPQCIFFFFFFLVKFIESRIIELLWSPSRLIKMNRKTFSLYLFNNISGSHGKCQFAWLFLFESSSTKFNNLRWWIYEIPEVLSSLSFEINYCVICCDCIHSAKFLLSSNYL